jgi:hypothetical protein
MGAARTTWPAWQQDADVRDSEGNCLSFAREDTPENSDLAYRAGMLAGGATWVVLTPVMVARRLRA